MTFFPCVSSFANDCDSPGKPALTFRVHCFNGLKVAVGSGAGTKKAPGARFNRKLCPVHTGVEVESNFRAVELIIIIIIIIIIKFA